MRAEYLGPMISVKVVDSLDEAIEHINRYSSQHTEAIVTRDLEAARQFAARIDSSAVMVNASTRFNDGGEFGLGAEIGISTDKFHARGPCGIDELTSYKYVVYGSGQVQELTTAWTHERDVLSQAEVENLLSAMASEGQHAAAGAARGAAAGRASRGGGRRNPARKSALRLQAAGARRQGADAGAADAARGVRPQLRARRFPALLRSMVEVKLTSVDQLTYSEFVFSLENPTCFNLLKAEPLEGNLILDINPSILYPIIDRLLGGGREAGPLARRPLTEIELRLVSRITEPVSGRAAARLGERASS